VSSRHRLVIAFALAILALPLAPAGAAPPAVAGRLAVLPATGTDQSALTLVTSGGCPAGSNLLATISGPGFPAAGQNVVGNTALTAFQRTSAGGFRIPLSLILRDVAALPARPVTFHGTYAVTVVCRDRVRLPSLGTFVGSLTFATPHAYRAKNPVVAVDAAPLDVSPGQPAPELQGPAGTSPPHAVGPGGQQVAPGTAGAGVGAPLAGGQPVASSSPAGSGWLRWAGLLVLLLGGAGLAGAGLSASRRRSRTLRS
jgi:hypothetical protein